MSTAFAAGIPSGKTEAVRAFIADILGPRKAEMEDLLRRSGIAEESYWLQLEPDATDILIVVTGDQTAYWAIMANPQTAFDRWYREQIETIWEFDASAPPFPANEHLGTCAAAG